MEAATTNRQRMQPAQARRLASFIAVSAAKNSFIYYPCRSGQTAEQCDATENHAPPIELTLLRTLADTDTLQWEIEALEGNGVTDDLASTDCNNGGSNPTCKKIAYNKIKHIQLTASGGNLPAHADTGTGRFEDAWRSAVITGGKLDETDARSIRFRPDPYPHFPETYGAPPKGTRGTNLTDIYRRNPRIGYKVTATVNRNTPFEKKYEKIVRMDYRDVIRQEYINHGIDVPQRQAFLEGTMTEHYNEDSGTCRESGNVISCLERVSGNYYAAQTDRTNYSIGAPLIRRRSLRLRGAIQNATSDRVGH